MRFTYFRKHKLLFGLLLFVVVDCVIGGAALFAYMQNQNNPKLNTASGSNPTSQTANTKVQSATTPSTGSQGSASTNSSKIYKPYVASVCTKIPIPYKTVYINASYLNVGETSEWGGRDGYTQTCTPDSNGNTIDSYTSPPSDKTVYVGTKVQPTAATTPQISQGEAYRIAQNNCSRFSGSSSYEVCIRAVLQTYGY
jgi:cytoskeletal protein RodZ